LAPRDIFVFSKQRVFLIGPHFESLKVSEQCGDSNESIFRKWFPLMFPGMAETLQYFYDVIGWVIWGKLHWIKISDYIFLYRISPIIWLSDFMRCGGRTYSMVEHIGTSRRK
jgi:hypothetical protein